MHNLRRVLYTGAPLVVRSRAFFETNSFRERSVLPNLDSLAARDDCASGRFRMPLGRMMIRRGKHLLTFLLSFGAAAHKYLIPNDIT